MFGRGAGGIGRTFDARQKIGMGDARQRLGGGAGAGNDKIDLSNRGLRSLRKVVTIVI